MELNEFVDMLMSSYIESAEAKIEYRKELNMKLEYEQEFGNPDYKLPSDAQVESLKQ